MGGSFSGFSFYVEQNRLHYAYNYFGLEGQDIAASEPLGEGRATLRVDFTSAGENKGIAALSINGKPVGSGSILHTVPITFGLSEGLTVGRDPSTPMVESYASPFPFTGKIERVVMEIKEPPKSAAKP